MSAKMSITCRPQKEMRVLSCFKLLSNAFNVQSDPHLLKLFVFAVICTTCSEGIQNSNEILWLLTSRHAFGMLHTHEYSYPWKARLHTPKTLFKVLNSKAENPGHSHQHVFTFCPLWWPHGSCATVYEKQWLFGLGRLTCCSQSKPSYTDIASCVTRFRAWGYQQCMGAPRKRLNCDL